MNNHSDKTVEAAKRARDSRELKARFSGEFVNTQIQAAKLQPPKAESVGSLEPGQLVFSVFDDMKLYGAETLDAEFANRQYDPYALNKRRLAASAETIGDQRESA